MAKSEPMPTPQSGAPPAPQASSTISRYVSFVVLVATILVCGFFFYNVIKGFLLPLFLAALLAVIFRPVHEWIAVRCKDRVALPAALSTTVIMLFVLVPLAGLVTLGLYEANQVVRDRKLYAEKLYTVRDRLGLQKPFADRLDAIETELRGLDQIFREAGKTDEAYLARIVKEAREKIKVELDELKVDALIAVKDLISDFEDTTIGEYLSLEGELREIERLLSETAKQHEVLKEDKEGQSAARLAQLEQQLTELRQQKAEYQQRWDDLYARGEGRLAIEAYALRRSLADQIGDRPLSDDGDEMTPEKRSLRYIFSRDEKGEPIDFLALIDDGFWTLLAAMPPGEGGQEQPQVISGLEMQQTLGDIQLEYDRMRTTMLGGPIRMRGIELVNPSSDQIDQWAAQLFMGGTRWLPSITNTATSLVGSLLVGLGIMAVALFYFLMDGPKMINTFMQLSPLDDRHELELLQEFDKVSRAVVLATLLSAVAQGILGGIGYKLVGLESVFLLTLLTAVLALIPFVGAAAIWVPCCLYIAFIKDPEPEAARTWMYTKAGFLAVYGVLIISMADNIIKPWVLQGQSKLHPLLALLSVLGGVQALGPIGILVGPMVIAFLQVLLTILQREIRSLDEAMKKASE